MLMGGIAGGIQASIEGRNILTGDMTLKDKLAILAAKYGKEATDRIGNGSVKGVHLANRKNTAKFDGRHKVFLGKIYGETGIEGGFAAPGKPFGINSDGYAMIQDNEIYLYRSTVRGMWKGYSSEIGTFFHEWQHCSDFFTGKANDILGNYPDAAFDMLEFRAHNVANSLYDSSWRRNVINTLFNKLQLVGPPIP